MFTVNAEMHNRSRPPDPGQADGFDGFGFVAVPLRCSFVGGTIAPVANHREVSEWVREHSYAPNSSVDDWPHPRVLFPPTTTLYQFDPRDFESGKYNAGVPIANSARPAETFPVPVSHGIALEGVENSQQAREGAAGFVTKAFSFLFDSPAQFHDWSLDGPASFGEATLDPTEVVASAFLTEAYQTWIGWPPLQQQAMIALLKMHARAPGHQWYWERFAWEYSVTDACYAVAAEFHRSLPKRRDHSLRLRRMIDLFGLSLTSEESEWLNTIICLRNELIHEARWAGNQPSTKTPDSALYTPTILHDLNQRLITALLGFKNDFVRSTWTAFSHCYFGLPKGE